MKVCVRETPFSDPLLDTDRARSIEIRDDSGKLALLLIFNPGNKTFWVGGSDDPDFYEFASGLGFPIDPSNPQETKGSPNRILRSK